MLKPLGNNVVLKIEEVNKKTNSGIILIDVDKEMPLIGEVVAVGEGEYINGVLRPLKVKINDKVYFKKYSAISINHLDSDYLIVEEHDILAIIE